MSLALNKSSIDLDFGITQNSSTASRREKFQLKMTFNHVIDVYLKDSNATGNVYFARHFEWQGICRERWFHQCIQEDMLQGVGVFVTKSAHQEFLQETFAFQKVDCYLNTYNIRHCSFSLRFKFVVSGQTVAIGHQEIVFAGHDKRIKKLPVDVLEKIKRYELTMEH